MVGQGPDYFRLDSDKTRSPAIDRNCFSGPFAREDYLLISAPIFKIHLSWNSHVQLEFRSNDLHFKRPFCNFGIPKSFLASSGVAGSRPNSLPIQATLFTN